MKKCKRIVSALALLCCSFAACANDAPVEDISQATSASANTSAPVTAAPAAVEPGQESQIATVNTSVSQPADAQIAAESGDNTSAINASSNSGADSGSNTGDDASSNNSINNQVPAFAPSTLTMPAVSVQNLTIEQRIARLEQQMANLTRMNLPQQISDIQQQLQQLSGELQVQSHDIKLLNDQQRSFYQDLDQRIKQLSNLNGSSNENGGATSSKNNLGTTDIALQDSDAYKTAFDQLTKKQYDKAFQGFQDYLSNYPNGAYQANAHYWLGEIYLSKKQKDSALNEFSTVVDKFPKSNKVSDAKLKIAMINAAEGKTSQAKTQFMQIKKQYPNSTAAQLASIQLQQLQ